jgi:hypothetical protein
MTLSPLEMHVFAYYVGLVACDLSVAPRFYPHGELILIIEDKVAIATRKYGFKVKACAKAVANAFVDEMIAAGGWSSKTNDFGGTMHQFQAEAFKAALRDMTANNPLVAEAQAAGPGYWDTQFAALTA